jgi:xanthine/CO dehydrogenase XdhC/CoxF family maturation factor
MEGLHAKREQARQQAYSQGPVTLEEARAITETKTCVCQACFGIPKKPGWICLHCHGRLRVLAEPLVLRMAQTLVAFYEAKG